MKLEYFKVYLQIKISILFNEPLYKRGWLIDRLNLLKQKL